MTAMPSFRTLLLATSALVPFGLTSAAANPLGAQVVGGSATVQGQGTATVTITQQTSSAIINWNTFNIGAGEKTKIIMPSSSSVQLDRVTGGLGPSQILGSLSSNGRVFLVNPDGILFGSGAVVDTAGFLATTHDIANANFMAGRYNFSIPGRPDASIVNLGTITARDSGFAALVAPGVRNSGTITATLGTVALASGNGFSLDLYGDRLITLNLNDATAASVKDVATGQLLSALVKNDGKIKANGGRVELTAAAARQVVDSVINNTGVIEANTIAQRKGMIVLSAATAASKPADAPTQTVSVSGKLSAAGKKKGSKGGTIQVTGEAIVLSGTTLDASGRSGGGVVLIGGDTGGGHPNAAVASIPQAQLQPYAVPNATAVKGDAATTINASAKDSGDGGKVVVWSDGATSFGGTIKATGGANTGDGGFVEVSGHQSLSYYGLTNTFAPFGKNGILLLDPLNTKIDVVAGTGIVTVAAIQNALTTNNVVVTTGATGSEVGDITVAAPFSWANANALTLSAFRNVAINANITNTGGAAVNLRSDNTGTGVGTVSFGVSGAISTAGPVSIFYNPTSYIDPSTRSTTSGNPYSASIVGGGALTAYMLVNDVNQLQSIQTFGPVSLTGIYALGKDINASATASWNAGAGFVPIGDLSQNFSGVLDGQGRIISNLKIDTTSSPNYTGLFGYTAASAIVRNVGLTNVSINGSPGVYVGGLVGWNNGLVSNSYVTGSVSGPAGNVIGGLVGENSSGTIQQSFASVTVSGANGGNIGGLVGENLAAGSISQSYASGSVTGATNGVGMSVGGLVASNAGTITQSYSDAAVNGSSVAGGYAIAGLVATNSGAISKSYSTGSITGDSRAIEGGLIGLLFAGGTITQTYAAGLITGGAPGTVGGFLGTNDPTAGSISTSYWDTVASGQPQGIGSGASAGVIGKTTGDLKSGLPTGFDASVWALNGSVNAGYPYLQWQTATAPFTSTTTFTGAVPTAGTLTPSLPADFTDIFGSGQVNTFKYEINMPVSAQRSSVVIGVYERLEATPGYDAAARIADALIEQYIAKFSMEGLEKDLWKKSLTALLVLGIPKNILLDVSSANHLISYFEGQLEKTLFQSSSGFGKLALDKLTSVVFRMLADGAAYAVMQAQPSLNENSPLVIITRLSTQMMAEGAYYGIIKKAGYVGAVYGATSAAAGQIVDALVETHATLSRTEEAIQRAEAGAAELRILAAKIQDRERANKLLEVADRSDTETARIRENLGKGFWWNIFHRGG